MPRTKQLNLPAIIKAYEAEAKRAERKAKHFKGTWNAPQWTGYALKIRECKQLAERETAQ